MPPVPSLPRAPPSSGSLGSTFSSSGRRKRAAGADQLSPHPVLSAGEGIYDAVKFVDSKRFLELPTPWPRCQDLKNAHALPSSDDVVVAVSHDWRYQTHPDPLGEKARILRDQLAVLQEKLSPLGRMLLFVDFLSVPQRPFAAGQRDRTVEEQRNFGVALGLMPRVYLLVDAVIHISSEGAWVPGDGEEHFVDLSELDGASFGEIGDTLQVLSLSGKLRHSVLAPFDTVASVDGEPVQSMAAFARLRQAGTSRSKRTVRIIKAPFGRRNVIPAGERGWIFLERFISMVKEAMLEETQVERVNFSKTGSILQCIHAGASRLRAAARVGDQALNEEMRLFFAELDLKRFAPTSTDAHSGESKLHGSAVQRKPSKDDATCNDACIVRGLMEGFVDDLQQHWSLRMRTQQQRQLVLAVNRGDVASCEELLKMDVNPNYQEDDHMRMTCLHSVAQQSNVAMARLLIAHGADPALQDAKGRCPAHIQAYYPTEQTLQLFNLLAPSAAVLRTTNNVGVSVARRFTSWAATATTSSEGRSTPAPFQPARALAAELEEKYPELFQDVEQYHSESGPRALTGNRPQLRRRVAACAPAAAGGSKQRPFEAVIWEPAGRKRIQCTVLYLAMTFAPWNNLCERFAEFIAEEINFDFAVRLVAVSYSAFRCSPSTTFAEMHEALAEIVRVLPLSRAPCILLDDSVGAFSPVLWTRAGARFAGAVLLNPWAFWDEDFMGSEAHQNLVVNIGQSIDQMERRDATNMAKEAGTFGYASSSKYSQMEEAYSKALSTAPPEFWCKSVKQASFYPSEIYEFMSKQSPLLAPPPVTLAYGAFAPAMMQRCAERYHKLIPSAKVTVISNSKFVPALELSVSESQTREIADILRDLVAEVEEQQKRGRRGCWLRRCWRRPRPGRGGKEAESEEESEPASPLEECQL